MHVCLFTLPLWPSRQEEDVRTFEPDNRLILICRNCPLVSTWLLLPQPPPGQWGNNRTANSTRVRYQAGSVTVARYAKHAPCKSGFPHGPLVSTGAYKHRMTKSRERESGTSFCSLWVALKVAVQQGQCSTLNSRMWLGDLPSEPAGSAWTRTPFSRGPAHIQVGVGDWVWVHEHSEWMLDEVFSWIVVEACRCFKSCRFHGTIHWFWGQEHSNSSVMEQK